MTKKIGLFSQFNLLRLNFFSLIIFEILYKAFGTFLFFPTIFHILRSLIVGQESDLVTIRNIEVAFSSIGNICLLIVFFILTAYYFLLEISVLTEGFKASLQGESAHFIPLFLKGLKTSLRYFNPINWPAFLIIFAFLPVLRFSLTSGLPEFYYLYKLLELYMTVTVSRIVFSLLAVVMVLAVFVFSFSFVYFTAYKLNFLAATYLSIRLYMEDFWGTILKIVKLFLAILLFLVFCTLILGVIGLFLYAYTLMMNNSEIITTSNSFFRQFINIFSPFVACLFLIYSVFITMFFFSGVYSQAYSLKDPEKRQPYFKKRRRYLSAVLMSVLIISYSVFQGHIISQNIEDDSLTIAQTGALLEGHRGNLGSALENTSTAYESAINNGAEYIELDVQRTADGVLVVSHDSNLERLTGQAIKIQEVNFEDIRDLPLGGQEGEGSRLMTLDEAIDLIGGKAFINIELKTQKNSAGFVQQTIDTIKAHGIQDQIYLASGNYNYIEQIEDYDPSITSLFLTATNSGDLENLKADGISVQYSVIDRDLIDRVHLRGKMIHAWVLEDEPSIQHMLNLGVDYIITNDIRMGQIVLANNRPDMAKQIRKVLYLILLQS